MSLLDDERALSQRYEANWMAEKERAEKAEAAETRAHATMARMEGRHAEAIAAVRKRAEKAEAAMTALYEEVARLRDALESIEGGWPCSEEHREMARAALKGGAS